MELLLQGGATEVACSPAPSGRAIMMGGDMVVSFSFTGNELLAKCLASCVAGNLATSACCFNSCLVSLLEVIMAGIFECAFVTTEVS